MKKYFILSLFITFSAIASAQPTAGKPIRWERSYGGTMNETAYSIVKTDDGDYIVAGTTFSNDNDVTFNNGNLDFWVVKINSVGGKQWQKTYGGSGDDVAKSIVQTSDLGYMVVGYTNSNDGDVTVHNGNNDFWAVKLSPTGALQWEKTFGGSDIDEANDVIQTFDGGFLIAGRCYSSDSGITDHRGLFDAWLIKTDALGDIQWRKSYGGTGTDEAKSVIQLTDNSFLMACSSNSNNIDVTQNFGEEDYWLVKLSPTGFIQWSKTLGGSFSDIPSKLIQTKDGNYFVQGSSSSLSGDVSGNHGASDFWAVSINTGGGIIWQKSLGGSGIDEGTSVYQLQDSSFILCGHTQSYDGDVIGNHGMTDSWVIRLDQFGGMKWTKSLGGSNYDYCYALAPGNFASTVIAGSSSSSDGNVSQNKGMDDYWIANVKNLMASFSASNDTICAKQAVFFTNYTSEANTYEWQINNTPFDNQFNTFYTFNSPGLYKISLIVSNALSLDTAFMDILVHPLPNVSLGNDTTLCPDASLTLDPGYNPNYSYNWSTSEYSPTIDVTTAGLYQVTVTDLETGCVNQDTIFITSGSAVYIDLGPDQTTCDGNTITLDAGYFTGFSYLWSTNETTQTIETTASGEYSVTVTDGLSGCFDRDTVNVTFTPKPGVNLGPDQNVCVGTTVTLDAGFINGATYNWSSGQTTQTIQPVSSGTYWVAVTDTLGCTGIDTVIVTFNSLPSVNLGADKVSCAGSFVTLDAGPNAGGTFLWSSGQTTQTIQPTITGDYSVTVTNAAECTDRDTIHVTYNPTPNVNLGPDQNVCAGTIVTLDAANSPGASYTWSSGQNSQTIQPTATGDYSVTVTNSFSCTDRDTVHININPLPSVNLGADKTSCTGTLVTLDAGPNPGGTYNWSSGQTTQTIQPVITGDYSVTVTNAAGCTDRDTVHVTYDPVPSVDLGPDQNICIGTTIILDAANSPGSTYYWSSSQTTQTQVIQPSTTSDYSVTVTNAFGCTDVDSVIVYVHPLPSVNLGPDQNICTGSTVTLDAGYSTGNTYIWSTSETSQIISVSTTGSYAVTVTNSFGCADADTIVINVNTPPSVSLGPDINACAGDTVSIGEIISGCTYLWQPGSETTPFIDVFYTGTYILKAINSDGCWDTDTIQVTFSIPPAIITDSIKDISCNGLADGAIFTSVIDGTPSFTYQWSDLSSATDDHTGLNAGSYSVTITDSKGCSDTASFVINEPNQIVIDSFIVSNTSCSYTTDGVISVFASGGTGTLLYSIDYGNTFQPNNDFPDLAPGTYSFVINDMNGCSKTLNSINISSSSNLTVTLGNDTTICFGSNITLDAANPGSAYLWSPGGETTQTVSASAGTYSVTVTSGGCSAADTVVINQFAAINISIDSVYGISCYGMNDGAIFTSVTGGVAPYSYAWSPAGGTEINDDYMDLVAGFYSVTVTDNAMCSATQSATVLSPNALAIVTDNVLNPTCNGAGNGAIFITASGGTLPYNFLWSSGQSDEDLIDLTDGNYTLTVTDGNGCTASETFVITSPPELTVSLDSVANSVICGSSTGGIYITPSGGTAPYTYIWSDFSTSQDLSGVMPGYYYVTVSDFSGCTAQTAGYIFDIYCQTEVAAGSTVVSVCDSINYIDVSPIVIVEYADTSAGFIKSQNSVHLILNAPNNFEFEQGVGNIYYGNGNNDITNASINITNQFIDITFSTSNFYSHLDTMSIYGLRVKALTNLLNYPNEIKMDPSSTAAINGITTNTIFAVLNQSTPMYLTNFSTFHVDSADMVTGSLGNCVAGIKISTFGNCGTPMMVQEFELNTAGSDNPLDNIFQARIFYTGHSPYFGAVDIQGTAVYPDGNFTIVAATPQELLEGDNYFWLAYDIKDDAIIGDSLEGQCIKAIIDGNYYYADPLPPVSLKRMVNMPGSFVSHNSGSWDDAYSWGGSKESNKTEWAPDENDDVTIQNGDIITLTSDASCRHLIISDGELILGSYQLTISGDLMGDDKNNITSTSSSSLVINDYGSAGQFPIPSAMENLQVLTLNRAAGAYCDHDLDLDDNVPADSMVLILSNGTLEFEDGYMLEMNSKAIQKNILSSNSTYVDGIVSRNIAAGAGFYLYPVGDDSECRPFGVATAAGISDNIHEVQFFWLRPINYDYINYGFLPGGITDKMYWNHQLISGNPTSKRRIYYHDEDFPGLSAVERIAALCLANNSGGTEAEWTKETTPYTINDNTGYKLVEFTAGNASNDPYWTFGSTVESSPLVEDPLPIELLSFDAVLNSDLAVDIDWTTVSETNNDYFNIERAGPDMQFVTLFTVNGAGNNYSLLAYHTVDDDPLEGVSYYRLKQTDFDGEFTYSSIRTVIYDAENPVLVFPNPARDQFSIQLFSQESDNVTISLFDDKGLKVYENEISITKGTNELTVDMQNLGHAVYILRIDFENNTIKPYRIKISKI